ncbi:MAG: hypothetical protein B7C24_08280 [Bacteroidetes bacterium 4572_77]|nr:MAG: hypothetical protein B7C24_08280 [Bacteroidetes bacterium 4572_77]
MDKKYLLLIVLFSTLYINGAFACTTFIISGKHTANGKPILFKHRDSQSFNNSLVFFSDGKYDYIAVVNAEKDNWRTMAWGGYNSEGFAIMNSAAYNNNMGDTTKFVDQEGVVMKLALQTCRTIEDFEELLKKLPKPLGVDANFGVIDAFGGAAYYETGNYTYKKIDANDPLVAPDGFLIRTNHSFGGDMNEGKGYIRYATAYSVLNEAASIGKLEPQYLFNHISRNMTHSLTNTNLYDNLPPNSSIAEYKTFIDYIPRYFTTSSFVVVGAKEKENPNNTMMWTILGSPLTSVAIPIWMTSKKQLPKIVGMTNNLHAPICDASLKLKENCFPIGRGSGKKYINLSVVVNKEKTGYLQLLEPVENEIFETSNALLKEMQSEKDREAKILEYYDWLNKYVNQSYKDLFNIELLE